MSQKIKYFLIFVLYFLTDKYWTTTKKHHIISLFLLQQMLTSIFDCFKNTTTTEDEDFIWSKHIKFKGKKDFKKIILNTDKTYTFQHTHILLNTRDTWYICFCTVDFWFMYKKVWGTNTDVFDYQNEIQWINRRPRSTSLDAYWNIWNWKGLFWVKGRLVWEHETISLETSFLI